MCSITDKGIGFVFCVFMNKILQFSQDVKIVVCIMLAFQSLVFQTELLEVEEIIHWVHNSPHIEFLIFTNNFSGL